jgi:hypothetical protein
MDVGGRQRRLPALYHRSCRLELLRTPEGRDWWSKRLKVRRSGGSAERADKEFGPHPPLVVSRHRTGKVPDRDVLTRNLKWTIEWLLGRDISLEDLAQRDHVKKQLVHDAITQTMKRLPEPPVTVPKTFASLIADLRTAYELRK